MSTSVRLLVLKTTSVRAKRSSMLKAVRLSFVFASHLESLLRRRRNNHTVFKKAVAEAN